jgi:hypothetical protein
MIYQDSVLVQLIRLGECIPTPQPPPQRPRGRPYLYLGEALYEGFGDHDREEAA